MTDSTDLERRYRRLLAFYPKAFRREREHEILSVLMAGAAEGQRRPRMAESFDLVTNAISMRARQTRLPGSWECRHARLMFPVRVLTGLWLVILTVILYGFHRGGLWGVLLVPSAALHFYLAYRLAKHLEQERSEPPGQAR
jgi:hypothetical protein